MNGTDPNEKPFPWRAAGALFFFFGALALLRLLAAAGEAGDGIGRAYGANLAGSGAGSSIGNPLAIRVTWSASSTSRRRS